MGVGTFARGRNGAEGEQEILANVQVLIFLGFSKSGLGVSSLVYVVVVVTAQIRSLDCPPSSCPNNIGHGRLCLNKSFANLFKSS